MKLTFMVITSLEIHITIGVRGFTMLEVEKEYLDIGILLIALQIIIHM